MWRQSIPLRVRYMSVDKPFIITIVGAESSGKTTLAQLLSSYFNCTWIPEYARDYLEGLGKDYTEEDLDIIAKRQWEEISKIISLRWSVEHEDSTFAPHSPSKDFKWSNSLEILIFHIKSSFVLPPWRIIIVDGGMMNLRMWARIKYKKTIPTVEESLNDDVTDLYLLCRPHQKWTPDHLREAPSLIDRSWIYNQYLEELIKSGKSMEILSFEENLEI